MLKIYQKEDEIDVEKSSKIRQTKYHNLPLNINETFASTEVSTF